VDKIINVGARRAIQVLQLNGKLSGRAQRT
jgi:hypothetical protein